MSEHADFVVQFRDVTGVDEDRARFYLESSGWKLDVLITNLFLLHFVNYTLSSSCFIVRSLLRLLLPVSLKMMDLTGRPEMVRMNQLKPLRILQLFLLQAIPGV